MAGNYADQSFKLYAREMQYLFNYYDQKKPSAITSNEIIDYVCYLKKVHQASHAKMKMFANACKFFYTQVINKPMSVPSKLYPRKEFKLPVVMLQHEVEQLLSVITNLKHRAIIELAYSSGMRLSEVSQLKIADINSKENYIRVDGKGKRERHTLLSSRVLPLLRDYYTTYKPVTYLFNGHTSGQPMYNRQFQRVMKEAVAKAGLNSRYSFHTLRHSFATHLLEKGVNLHHIKELMGHSSLSSTLVYLHLTLQHQATIVSPLDHLKP